ncbi:histidine phosphatase family protein [Burkholderia ubonensis]|uniref:Phosphoglycerate mutase n=1 Tax=Burkholderia ubonensis TaxID=101571 RepID=A0A107EP79_9BURK|nr:histidine phosphatase family protein [Burkholderia ubonensis]AOK62198.1 phosphoglycerate mutase [Burkholderia ubonensis]KWD76802.1 phosphoglycerate mutase [Burkholderia ubonensis]KWD78854.1 phosphoglycerate mutase [Burkholderia ubonensis]KWD92800.1 phosphoglycerate mutase [Burkholderia ubonensis]KWD99870.1 phosphoglycerate mutase [Burkholderia ubonensis]
MSLHVRLIAHAATRAMRTGVFPDDDPLDARGLAQAADARASWPCPPGATVVCAPARCARQTAAALALDATVEPALADIDYGRWRGRRVADVAREAPSDLHAWMTDPSASPHGGDSFDAVRRRIDAWLDRLPPAGDVIAIASATVIRAALAHASCLAAETAWRMDITPLSAVELSRNRQGWTSLSGPAPPADGA